MLKMAKAKKIHPSPPSSPDSSPLLDGPLLLLRAYFFSGVVPMDDNMAISAVESFETDDSLSDSDFEGSCTQDTPYDDQLSMCGSPSGSGVLTLFTAYQSSIQDELRQRAYVQKLAMDFKMLAEKSRVFAEQKAIEEAAARILVPFYPTYGSAWFSDTIMDRWFDLLSHNHARVANIHTTPNPEAYLREIAQDGPKQDDRTRLQQANTIFWPLVFNNHWFLLTIEKKVHNSISISCSDGLNLFGVHKEALFRFGERLLSTLYTKSQYDALETSYESWPVTLQRNGDDCGPIICCEGLKICERLSGKRPGNYTEHRQSRLMIAATLLQGYTEPETFINGYIPHGKIDRSKLPKPNITPQFVIEIDDAPISGPSLNRFKLA